MKPMRTYGLRKRVLVLAGLVRRPRERVDVAQSFDISSSAAEPI
jgi:hypothetical protein